MAPAGSKSGRSSRHLPNTFGHRGLNAHPFGMASSRGIDPSICGSRSTSCPIAGIDPISPAV